jgi:Ras-related protein Rab-1A
MADLEVVKILLVGDEAVGKSAILRRFTNDVFPEEYITTIGVDFGVRPLETVTKKIRKLQVWDTAGQERFRTITSSYYRGAHFVFIVYDITNRASFENVKAIWINEVRKFAAEHIKMALVGNKADLEKARAVSPEEAEEWAVQQNMQFIEVSARAGQDEGEVNKLFQWAIDVLQIPERKLSPSPLEDSIQWMKKIRPFWDSVSSILAVKNGLSFYEPVVKFTAPGLLQPHVQQWIAINSATLTPEVLTKMTHFVHLNSYERKGTTIQQAVHLALLGRAINSQKLIDAAVGDLMLSKAEDSDIMSIPKLIGDSSVVDLNQSVTELNDVLRVRRDIESRSKQKTDSSPKFEKQWLDLIGHLYADRDSTGDMTVIVEGKHYKAHKMVLIYNCDFFGGCMLSQFREADKAEIKLDAEVTIAAWECLLKYFYTFELSHIEEPDDCLAIISVAPYLMLTSEAKSSVSHARLLKHCNDTAYNSITDESVLELLLSAHKNEDSVAKEVAMKYITNNYFKLMETYESEFMKLPKQLMFSVMNRLILHTAKK